MRTECILAVGPGQADAETRAGGCRPTAEESGR